MLLSYIKRRWKTIAAMAIFAAMFAMVFSLDELPAEAVLEARLLCGAGGALLLEASCACGAPSASAPTACRSRGT